MTCEACSPARSVAGGAAVARLPARGALAAVMAAALLSACGSVPPAGDGRAASAGAPTASAPAGARKAGGYYLDDGPGDSTPPNLDSVPDAEPRLEPLHRFANRPYHVMGQSFVPGTELRPYRERGHASWYGRRFHGNPTSSGEPYDMYAMTAAHPTLPIPSYARVTNLANGRAVVVRVNDRGPFLRGRVIDLSYTAAHKLGYVGNGSAEVEVEQILPDEVPMVASARPVAPLPGRGAAVGAGGDTLAQRPLAPLAAAPVAPTPPAAAATLSPPPAGLAPPVASASAGIYLQLGAFGSYANAEGFRDNVQAQAGALAQRFELLADGERFRLHAGPYESVDAARKAADRLTSLLKLKPFVVVR